jgi:hypothetical protein
VDKLPKATITGYVTAEMNFQNDGEEAVPAGTELFVEVSYADINPDAVAGKWQDTVSVGTDGKYETSVPADANGVVVTITPFAFEANQTQPYGALFSQIKKSYTAAQFTVAIRSGQILPRNYSYIAANLPNLRKK